MLKCGRCLFVLAVDFLIKLIVCRFLYVDISCLNPNPKVGGHQIYGNGELFIVFVYVFPAPSRSLVL